MSPLELELVPTIMTVSLNKSNSISLEVFVSYHDKNLRVKSKTCYLILEDDFEDSNKRLEDLLKEMYEQIVSET